MPSQLLPQQQQNQPNCEVCNIQSVPESNQHIVMIIFEIILSFFNWKFSIILLMIGYSFPRTVWKCSYCNREVGEIKKSNAICQNIIIRMGNCMALFSLSKFRIIAITVTTLMVYLYLNEPKYTPKVTVTNTWQSIVENCGYQAYMENSFRANHFYQQYYQTGYNWELSGIFLQQKKVGIEDYQFLLIKMNPTQFKNENAHDFRVYARFMSDIHLQKGDILLLKGGWGNKKFDEMVFETLEIKKIGKKSDFKDIQYFYKTKSMLRSHINEVKANYIQTDSVQPQQPQIQQNSPKS